MGSSLSILQVKTWMFQQNISRQNGEAYAGYGSLHLEASILFLLIFPVGSEL